METKKAIEVLEKHQAWRRDLDDASGLAMQDPKELGKAIDHAIGLLKENDFPLRDYFAAKEDGLKIIDGISPKNAEQLLGKEIPTDVFGNNMFWMELSAKLQYMKADAMLKERQKTN